MSHEKIYLQHTSGHTYKLQCDEDAHVKRVVVPHNPGICYKVIIADTFEVTINGEFLVETVHESLDDPSRILWQVKGLKEKLVKAGSLSFVFEEPLEVGKRFVFIN